MNVSEPVGVPGLVDGGGLVDVLRSAYGIRPVSFTALGGEIDTNLHALLEDGSSCVVKVSAPEPDLAALAWQHDLLVIVDRAARAGQAPPVPRPVPTVDGTTWTVAGDRAIRVHEWLSGTPMHALDRHSPQLLHGWGTAAGQLVRALPRQLPDGVFVGHHWDLLRSDEAIGRHLPAVHDPSATSDIERIVERFGAALAQHAQHLPRQVVHQDLNDFNVLAAPDEHGMHRVCGVLDFADALHTARVSELAVAVAYAMLAKPDPLAAAADVTRGFDDVVALTDHELAVVFPLACARLCVNAVTWTARSDSNPDYARARMRHTFGALRLLAGIPAELARAALHHAVARPLAAKTVRGQVPAIDGVVAAPHLAARADRVMRRRTDDGEPATVHLGVSLCGAVGRTLLSPSAATVESTQEALLLRHGSTWSRWRGVETSLTAGDPLDAGEPLGVARECVEVALFDSRELAALAPESWVPAHLVPAWRAVSPDPAPYLAVPVEDVETDAEQIVATREHHFARSQRSYYRAPMALVRGSGSWLYDGEGRGYLDAINNVSHVGHANEAVAEAGARQLRRLNTNSRFVYAGLADYSQRLAALLPDPLEVVFLVCTGSEANDLALRIARQVTRRRDVLVIDGAYHGNTAAVTDISPNRYRGPGGAGRPATTHELTQPNRYRGVYRGDDAAQQYAPEAVRVVAGLAARGTPPAAFIAESLMGTAGTVVYPPGYLTTVFAAVRAAGGLCISDEVQVGFGRLGAEFWGFQTNGVVPDIVTMGKPIGNGHPMAAVVTTREIADAFDSGMKYFNTFGGNPVSCAIGNAVLDEIERMRLRENAISTGGHLRDQLVALQRRHEIIGDVRGTGLYLGVELVRSRESLEPAGVQAYHVSERMKDEGVIVYPTGPHDNVLKIKPPMVFGRDDADVFVDALDQVLSRAW